MAGTPANVLVGRYPKKDSCACEDAEWYGWNDPLFTAALDVVEETLESQNFEWNLKPLFRLQMAYLLLWSSIERYVSLRYHLGDRVTEKVGHLANEAAFVKAYAITSGRGVRFITQIGRRRRRCLMHSYLTRRCVTTIRCGRTSLMEVRG